uniref:Ubiquitin-like protease family profile domain-containing protein n=2 Tax=Clytia hemisphaerica TaxID=252671 RepID=A0A7M5V3V3_9CNID
MSLLTSVSTESVTSPDSPNPEIPHFEVCCGKTDSCLEDIYEKTMEDDQITTQLGFRFCSDSEIITKNSASPKNVPDDFGAMAFDSASSDFDPLPQSSFKVALSNCSSPELKESFPAYQSFDDYEDDSIETVCSPPLSLESSHSSSVIDESDSVVDNILKLNPNTLDAYFHKTNEIVTPAFDKPVFQERNFHFRQPIKEKYFCNLIFSRHYSNVKNLTPANMPVQFQSFEDFLDSQLPDYDNVPQKLQELVQSAKANKDPAELKMKAFLCGSFPPILTGNTAHKTIIDLAPNIQFPQFSVLSYANNLRFACNVCKVFAPYAQLHGRSCMVGTGEFVGFRQVYEHALSAHHNYVIDYLMEKNDLDDFLPKKSEKVVTDFFPVERKGSRVACHYLWQHDIVNCFRDDRRIRTKQAETLFKERKPWKRCLKEKGHKNCVNFKFWQQLHSREARNYWENDSSRSVFVPGETKILIGGKCVELNGGIKSLDPVCTGLAVSNGDHPYTCKNCYSQRGDLKGLMKKRKKSKLTTLENRVGKSGFNKRFATKTEEAERVKQMEVRLKILNKEIKFNRVQNEKKTWEQMILRSCSDGNVKKLIVDLASLMQQENKRDSIQMEILQNIVGKLKSGVNHKYTNLIKDVAVLYKNKLGVTSYSDLKDLFCLPSKTCVQQHSKENKLHVGLNEDVFDKAVDLYCGGPVIEASDEARTLRFLSPVVGKGNQIELIGKCWDPDISKWEDSRDFLKNVISDKTSVDEFSALKDHIKEMKSSNSFAKDTAIHNFVAASGVMSKPLVFLFWPTPNSDYCAPNLLKIWDVVRKFCFLDGEVLRENPVNLLGHSTDSAGFQLAAAVALMTPQSRIINAGVKYLTLGCGESKFAAPYFGPLPSIAYLDYDHNLRLFLKCLKYTTLDLNIFPSKTDSYIVTINHLKELKQIADDSGVSCDFSNSDLLFARYLDQNSDAALKVFTLSVAELLEDHVPESAGTVLYIRGVVALFDPFINPDSNPIVMQEKISEGITVFRIWRKILELKKKRLNATSGAAKNPSKRGRFLTYGCYKTAEILFTAATCHMLAIFAHFRDLGPSALSPFKCGTKTTERIISELQGKTNHLQSLDAQPTLSDISSRLSKVQANQLSEENIMARGGKKHASTNRRRLSHKWKKVQSSSDYKFPDTYEEFRNGQRKAYRAGVLKGIELFKKHCPEGAKFVKDNGDFDFLRSFNHDVPYESQFDGTLNDGYALDKLRNLNPSELLTSKAEKKEKKITDFLNPEDKEEQKRADQEYTPEGDDSESTVENKNVEGVSSKNCESSSVVDDELIEEKLKPVSVGIEEVSAKKCEPTSVEDDELSREKVKVVSSGIEETSSMKGATSKSEVKAEQRTPDKELELSDGELEIAEEERLDERWYITRLIKGKLNRVHLKQALKILIPREYVSRERSRRHIASKFLPDSKEIDENHNVLLFRFVIAKIANEVVVCKVSSLNSQGKSIMSASSDDKHATCRLIPLEKVPQKDHVYRMSDKIVVSDWLKISNILGEISMEESENGHMVVMEKSRAFIWHARATFMLDEDRKIAQKISKGLLPSEFKEVDDILDKKLDPNTHLYVYLVKFKGQVGKEVWLDSSCFDKPFQYGKRSGLKVSDSLFADEGLKDSKKVNDISNYFQKNSNQLRKANTSSKNESEHKGTAHSTTQKEQSGKSKTPQRKRKSDNKPTKKLPIKSRKIESTKKTTCKRSAETSSNSKGKKLKILKSSVDFLQRFSCEPKSTASWCSSSNKEKSSKEELIALSDDDIENVVVPGCDKIRTDVFDWNVGDDRRICNGSWMSDNIMNRARIMLKRQFPNLKGLQETLYSIKGPANASRFLSFKEDRIQMHHDGEQHWALSVSKGSKVMMLDSSKEEPTENLKNQLLECYRKYLKDGELDVEYQSVCRQTGCNDCGLFVIAFATDLAFDNDPVDIWYDQTRFRLHLKECFSSGKLSPFPRLSNNTTIKRMSLHIVKIQDSNVEID